MVLQEKFLKNKQKTKTIEDQGEKQIKAIQNQKNVKTIKKYDFDRKDRPWISKQREIFNELADKRLNEITELYKNVNLDDLIYRYKGDTPNEEVNTYDNALDLIDKIKNGEIKLLEAKNDQINFKSSLGEIKRGNNKKRSKEQKIALYNRNEAIKFFDDYYLMVSEAKTKAKNKTTGSGLKILTPKQMLQGLPIVLAQVKAGNTSENLLNEIRQIVYSPYRAKEITKKVYNNIIKSI